MQSTKKIPISLQIKINRTSSLLNYWCQLSECLSIDCDRQYRAPAIFLPSNDTPSTPTDCGGAAWEQRLLHQGLHQSIWRNLGNTGLSYAEAVHTETFFRSHIKST